ncbi:MAG: prephenate dehydrogenase/arogenate dehydrogenase family protein [Clostridiales Family XIII bacterium]|jgi:prephenate dehydrogenase|nr:prephenate dehydrogenase/arogenate dehydrogenase family protein [Clostridiales Family XIII bacterium]
MAARFDNILIIGLGLIGGSLAGALKAFAGDEQASGGQAPAGRQMPAGRHGGAGARIYGLDSNPDASRKALDAGFVDSVPDRAETLRLLSEGGIDLVVLAVPVDAYGEWFALLTESGYEGVLTDTGSTKGPAIEYAQRHLKNPERFVPGHPMAGSEREGIDGARPDLFQGAYWLLTPGSRTDIYAFRRLHELLTGLGTRVLSVSPAEHDRVVAIVSHVPHIAAAALVTLAGAHAGENGEMLRLAAGGFKDTTRIAAGSAELWTGILLNNADIVAEELDELQRIVADFGQLLRAGDAEGIRARLADASRIRSSLPAQWVQASARLVEIRIPMDDRRGIIAEITTAAGRAECNIEAIDIDHQTEDRAVLELVLTDEGDIDGFLDTLRLGGFRPQRRML